MKRCGLFMLSLLIMVAVFYTKSKHQKLIGLSQQDCYFCGNNEKSTFNNYVNHDSIGMINLNTWEVTEIEINSAKRMKSGLVSTKSNVNKEGSNINVVTLPERRICDISVDLKKDSVPNAEKMSKILCDNCIDKILSLDSELGVLTKKYKTPDYAIIDFKTNEIHSINKLHILYFIRDYCVSISYNENRIRVFIVYTPIQDNENFVDILRND